MVFIETTIFTKNILSQLPDDEYKTLQKELINNPARGEIIRGSNGLRKFRWGVKDRGKSGGIRIIYYWDKEGSRIFLLLSYSKNEMDNLTTQQTKVLSKLVRETLL